MSGTGTGAATLTLPENSDVLLVASVAVAVSTVPTATPAGVGIVKRNRFVVSVPAFSWLWSQHDEFLGHRRMHRHGGVEIGLGRSHLHGNADHLDQLAGIRAGNMTTNDSASNAVDQQLHEHFGRAA